MLPHIVHVRGEGYESSSAPGMLEPGKTDVGARACSKWITIDIEA